MRVFLAISLTASTLALGAAHARADGNRWCAYFDPWTKNCEFGSQQACETAMSGTGKRCEPNPGYQPDTLKRTHHKEQR